MEGQGAVIGKKAPDFLLPNQDEDGVALSDIIKKGPVLLAFYPSDFGMVCTKQLCNYQDNLSSFEDLGVQVYGISRNSPESHQKFRNAYHITFPLLSDHNSQVARVFGCTSIFMLGRNTRAVYIISPKGLILYRYVEPTSLTRRDSEELIKVVKDLKNQKII